MVLRLTPILNPLGQDANTLGYTQEDFWKSIVSARNSHSNDRVPDGWSNMPTAKYAPAAVVRVDKVLLSGLGRDAHGYYYGTTPNLWEGNTNIDGATPFRFRASSFSGAEAVVKEWFPLAKVL